MTKSGDTISRAAAIELLSEYPFEKVVNCISILEEMPSAQPEIIYCKDCKYAEYIDDVQTLWCTECGQGRTVAPCDFCSYAERGESDGRLGR